MSSSGPSARHVPHFRADQWSNDSPFVLAVKEHKTIVLLAPEEIDWIEAAGDYVCVHAGGRKHLLREKISQITLQVPAAHFARIHRSSVVNLDRVVRVVSCSSGETLVHLSSGDILHVSRTFKKAFLRRFKPG